MVKRRLMLVALVPVLGILLGSMSPQHRNQAMPGHIVTVPIQLDHNRVYIDATLTGPTGRSKTTRLWVDTGSQGLDMSETLARELGIEATGSGTVRNSPDTPTITIGGVALNTGGVQPRVWPAKSLYFRVGPAEAILGTAVLSHYTVVFDYPQKQLSLLEAGVATKRGMAIDVPIKPQWYPSIKVAIDGQQYDMLLDTGASYTMFAEGITRELSGRHPDWARSVGAVGSANMGLPDEGGLLMLQLPQMGLGTNSVQNVGVVTRSDQTWREFSSYTAVPIVGALAGNVLRHFRLEIDYQAHTAYLEQSASGPADNMTLTGLVLSPGVDGTWFIDSVSDRQPIPSGETVLSGDQLISVDGTAVTGLTWGSITDTLRGRAGKVKTLMLERQGTLLKVRLSVTEILP